MNNFNFDLNALEFISAIHKLPETLQNQLPDNYGYLWAKCSMMKNLGFERYSTGDYLGYPVAEFITEDFEYVVDQVINNLRGFTSDNPIELTETITMHYFAYSMHFKINLIQDFVDGLIQVHATHLVEDDEVIALFFIKKKM